MKAEHLAAAWVFWFITGFVAMGNISYFWLFGVGSAVGIGAVIAYAITSPKTPGPYDKPVPSKEEAIRALEAKEELKKARRKEEDESIAKYGSEIRTVLMLPTKMFPDQDWAHQDKKQEARKQEAVKEAKPYKETVYTECTEERKKEIILEIFYGLKENQKIGSASWIQSVARTKYEVILTQDEIRNITIKKMVDELRTSGW